jgi:hypothetical protein
MSKAIQKIYKEAKIKAPIGKGLHTMAFHRLAVSIMKPYKSGGLTKKEKAIAYATSMKILGRNKAVKKSHWR